MLNSTLRHTAPEEDPWNLPDSGLSYSPQGGPARFKKHPANLAYGLTCLLLGAVTLIYLVYYYMPLFRLAASSFRYILYFLLEIVLLLAGGVLFASAGIFALRFGQGGRLGVSALVMLGLRCLIFLLELSDTPVMRFTVGDILIYVRSYGLLLFRSGSPFFLPLGLLATGLCVLLLRCRAKKSLLHGSHP